MPESNWPLSYYSISRRESLRRGACIHTQGRYLEHLGLCVCMCTRTLLGRSLDLAAAAELHHLEERERFALPGAFAPKGGGVAPKGSDKS